ncbi:hypothetical protein EMCG_03987 [[Emmonsia] crescens]|uniref:Uncharacterized protein n=1 Tax=[Emmonsia] crescens TaxID=73230 RepID=A0A0G2J7Z1_9EURO|nr:hypothetical protein EMCG_03987 [Emmonsia crescens UAMH 3008]
MSAPARRAITGLRNPHVRSMGALALPVKEQPWKAFWPLNAEKYSAEEKDKMPWLTWKFDPNKPTDRPWRKWMLENQTTVVRRGAW